MTPQTSVCTLKSLHLYFNQMKKIVIVMPAFNAEKTLERTFNEIPEGLRENIILVDDGSTDRTVEVSRKLGIYTIKHEKNKGYGANLKTCFNESLKRNPSVVVVLHPDYQYDGSVIPQLVKPVIDGEAEIVLGSRFLKYNPREGGMPAYKFIGNRFLTSIQNLIYGLKLSEYHTGLRAYSADFLKSVPYENFSNGFVFDSQIITFAVAKGARIKEIPARCRYLPESSSINFMKSVHYGLGTLWTAFKWIILKKIPY